MAEILTHVDSKTAGLIRAYVQRAERLQQEIDARNADKRDLFKEAKGLGLCPKTLKAVLQRRRKEPGAVEQGDVLLEMYEDAVAGAPTQEPLDPLEL